MVTADEIRAHDSRRTCWVIIHGEAYDVTEFLNEHPGGPSAILRLAGKDATEEYEPVHPAGTIESYLGKGVTHMGTVEAGVHNAVPSATGPTLADNELPPLSTIQNLGEFETVAKKILTRKAWIYYSSATDTLSSLKRNRADWAKVNLRPRMLRNVGKISMRRRIMGHDSDLPFFIAPAAQARLGHEDGELCLARGAARHNIPYCTSTYTSVAHNELADCLSAERKGGALLFQLYVPVNKPNAKQLVETAKRLGFKALVITVDSAVIGKREEDDRFKAELDHQAGINIPRSLSTEGDAPVVRGSHSSTLDWDDLKWIREVWNDTGPVILKGIQTAEDAVLAAQAGVDGIYLSNHGGRQMDYSPSSLQTLLEIRKFHPELLNKLEIYLDGSVTRGSDAMKAIALGARAVGIGRPFMYALSAYGTDGVCRAIELLNDEIQTTMRLLGVTDLNQLTKYYVNTSLLERELPQDIDSRQLSKL